MLNFPFPEVYFAPGELNTDKLLLSDQVVDGQQRLTTIYNYIEEKDVFVYENLPIKKFSELGKGEKNEFLNYEVSVRYLKNANHKQIKEIFQRINSTEYSLNATERINAQWGDSEFICFSKQIVEVDLDIDLDLINYKISEANRTFFVNFFHKKYNIFTENDINRMLALQYILTLVTTLCEKEYFRRNTKVQSYIENYFDEFIDAGEVELNLLETLKFIDNLNLPDNSYWFNKANIFTLIVECYNYNLTRVNPVLFKMELEELEYYNLNHDFVLIFKEDIERGQLKFAEPVKIPKDMIKYFDLAKEAVNEKNSREYRGKMVREMLDSSSKDDA